MSTDVVSIPLDSIKQWNSSDHLGDETDILLYLGIAADQDDDALLALAKKNVAVARERHRKEYEEERARQFGFVLNFRFDKDGKFCSIGAWE